MKAGWYYVPGDGRLRYWDGNAWTDAYRDPEAGEPFAADAAKEVPILETLPSNTKEHTAGVPRLVVALLATALMVLGAASIAAWKLMPAPILQAAPVATSTAIPRALSTDSPVAPSTQQVPTATSPTVIARGGFADLYAAVSSGVVRIASDDCDGSSVGSGFLVAPDLVATVAHVVDGAITLTLTVGENGEGGTSAGVVIGLDQETDVALIRTAHPVDGHVFTLADGDPSVGEEVAAIGFPVDSPMTLTTGAISGLDRTVNVEGIFRTGMIQTDIAVNPGNSGGPMLTTDGVVSGLIDAKRTAAEGIAFAVSPATAAAQLDAWRDRLSPTTPHRCTSDSTGTPDSLLTACSGTVSAGIFTSCPFALRVEQAWRAAGRGSVTVEVSSPVTGQAYRMQCSDGDPVICTGGNAAVVFIKAH